MENKQEKEKQQKNEKKELEQKVLELGALDNKFRELEQQLNMLEKQISELQSCQISFDELKNITPGTELLAPISQGVFVKTKLLDNSKIIINTGAKVFCKKSIEEAKEFMQSKINQVNEIHNRLVNEINVLAKNISSIEQELRAKGQI